MTATRLWFHTQHCKAKHWCKRERHMPLWAQYGFDFRGRRVFTAHRGWRNGKTYPFRYNMPHASFLFVPFTPWGIGWTKQR